MTKSSKNFDDIIGGLPYLGCRVIPGLGEDPSKVLTPTGKLDMRRLPFNQTLRTFENLEWKSTGMVRQALQNLEIWIDTLCQPQDVQKVLDCLAS